MKRTASALLLCSGLLAAAGCPLGAAADRPLVLDVWPGRPPGETTALPPEADATKPTDNLIAGRPVVRLGNVSRPTLHVFRPAKEQDTGAAVLIAPGGGYNILAWDLEGEEVAAWLNGIGVTGIVLKYRVPRRPGQPAGEPPIGPLQDAQRALSLIRSKAGEWGLDPRRLGMLGFSAGGHLTAAAATGFDRRAYEAVDEVDRQSCRPDFTVYVYPGYLVGQNTEALNPALTVTSETPPAFFAHAGDDRVRPENSVAMYLALKKAGVPAELHVYSAGGHGFGLRPTEQPVTSWPRRCEDWLRRLGTLRRP